jgi:hypothetical protein
LEAIAAEAEKAQSRVVSGGRRNEKGSSENNRTRFNNCCDFAGFKTNTATWIRGEKS